MHSFQKMRNNHHRIHYYSQVIRMIAFKSFNEIVDKPINWFWKPFIAFGKVSLIQGSTGVGKTNILVKLLADISRGIFPPTLFQGRLFPAQRGDPLNSYYVTVENGIEDTIGPLFGILGGNRDHAFFQDETEGHFVLSGEEIEECVRRTSAKIIVVDPWQQFIDGDTSDNSGLRCMVCDLQTAAEKTGAAIILSGNYIKGYGPDVTRGIGGAEFSNTLRIILTVKEDPEGDRAVRILEATKMSLLGRELDPIIVRQDKELKLTFETDQVFYEEEEWSDDPVIFLKNILKDGPVDSSIIKQLAEESGIGMSKIYRSREKAGIIIQKQPNKSSLWKLA